MSNPLQNTELNELVERYNYLIKQYASLALEIAPKIEKFGKVQQELDVIDTELKRRNFQGKTADEIQAKLEEELKKRLDVLKTPPQI